MEVNRWERLCWSTKTQRQIFFFKHRSPRRQREIILLDACLIYWITASALDKEMHKFCEEITAPRNRSWKDVWFQRVLVINEEKKTIQVKQKHQDIIWSWGKTAEPHIKTRSERWLQRLSRQIRIKWSTQSPLSSVQRSNGNIYFSMLLLVSDSGEMTKIMVLYANKTELLCNLNGVLSHLSDGSPSQFPT